MGQIEILSRRLARDQLHADKIQKRIEETQREIGEWKKNQEYLTRRETIRNVALIGWFLFRCPRGHESRYLTEQAGGDYRMLVCWEQDCDDQPVYVGRDPATDEQIANWRREGYLPKKGKF